jgi:hypothetical protein
MLIGKMAPRRGQIGENPFSFAREGGRSVLSLAGTTRAQAEALMAQRAKKGHRMDEAELFLNGTPPNVGLRYLSDIIEVYHSVPQGASMLDQFRNDAWFIEQGTSSGNLEFRRAVMDVQAEISPTDLATPSPLFGSSYTYGEADTRVVFWMSGWNSTMRDQDWNQILQASAQSYGLQGFDKERAFQTKSMAKIAEKNETFVLFGQQASNLYGFLNHPDIGEITIDVTSGATRVEDMGAAEAVQYFVDTVKGIDSAQEWVYSTGGGGLDILISPSTMQFLSTTMYPATLSPSGTLEAERSLLDTILSRVGPQSGAKIVNEFKVLRSLQGFDADGNVDADARWTLYVPNRRCVVAPLDCATFGIPNEGEMLPEFQRSQFEWSRMIISCTSGLLVTQGSYIYRQNG